MLVFLRESIPFGQRRGGRRLFLRGLQRGASPITDDWSERICVEWSTKEPKLFELYAKLRLSLSSDEKSVYQLSSSMFTAEKKRVLTWGDLKPFIERELTVELGRRWFGRQTVLSVATEVREPLGVYGLPCICLSVIQVEVFQAEI